MIRWLRDMLILNLVLVPIMACLPLACVPLVRTPEGAMAFFWLGPLSAGFWTLIYSQLSAAPWRQGAEAVRRWREENGGLLHTSIIATMWMFAALVFSYAAELLLIWTTHNFTLLPIATYSPIFFCWCWRRFHG